MRTILKLLLLVFKVTLLGCACNFSEVPSYNIILFKDKFGIYVYNPTTQKEQEVYKAVANEIFLREPIEVVADTLVFAVKGELKISTQNNGVEHYTKKFYSLNLSIATVFYLRPLSTLLKAVK